MSLFLKNITKKSLIILLVLITNIFILRNQPYAYAAGYTVSGHVTVENNGGMNGINVVLTGAAGSWSSTTDINGDYSITNLPAGLYYGINASSAKLGNVGGVSQGFSLGPDKTGENADLAPTLITVSGTAFNDTNGNKKQDAGEGGIPNVTAVFTTVTSTIDSNISDANGHFTLNDGNFGCNGSIAITVPSGYTATTPTSINTSCSGVPGGGANFGLKPSAPLPPPPAPGGAGNIVNLNFGITDNNPWVQSTCGDIRNDNGFTNLEPFGQSAIITDATCTTPGIVFTGDTTATFNKGQISSSNQLVGGTSYPEVFSSSTSLVTSYTSLLTKAQNANITPVNLATVCTISNCTLPNNLAHGIYLANGDVTFNANKLKNNSNYIFLINGNLTLNGDITIPKGSTALFSTAKDIIVSPTIGVAAVSTTASLDGWYIAGQSFIINSQNNCNDLRLNIAGSVVVNALGKGGTFQNNRDLCGNDAADPTVTFNQRLDMILNAPSFIRQQQTISQELAP